MLFMLCRDRSEIIEDFYILLCNRINDIVCSFFLYVERYILKTVQFSKYFCLEIFRVLYFRIKICTDAEYF